jgi:hypothetical protein
MAKQTDNHNPDAKLLLRKYFLEKYHADGSATVFDCCQGGGLMWGTIRNTHPVASYWGVDVKPKKGRLKIDSIRVVEQGLTQNVIDIDTYGSPWKHWVALLGKLNGAKTVFLTIGTKNTMPRKVSIDELALIGCDIENLPAPFAMKLQDICTDAMLAAALKVATITEAQEATRGVAARYIGVRLEPKKDGQHVSDADRQNTSVERN